VVPRPPLARIRRRHPRWVFLQCQSVITHGTTGSVFFTLQSQHAAASSDSECSNKILKSTHN
jgi:hypothetical protein